MQFKHLSRLTSNYLSKRIIFALDMVLSLFASLMVILIVNTIISRNLFSADFFWPYIAAAFIATAVMSYVTQSYRIIIRHLVVRDIVTFGGVALGKAIAIVATLLACRFRFENVLLIVLLDFFGTFFLLVGVRIAMILVYNLYNSKVRERSERQRILVYDTSDKSLATLLRLHNSTHYRVVGFLIHGKATENLTIDRIPVYPFEEEKDFNRILERSGADAVLFSKDTDAQREENEVIK